MRLEAMPPINRFLALVHFDSMEPAQEMAVALDRMRVMFQAAIKLGAKLDALYRNHDLAGLEREWRQLRRLTRLV